MLVHKNLGLIGKGATGCALKPLSNITRQSAACCTGPSHLHQTNQLWRWFRCCMAFSFCYILQVGMHGAGLINHNFMKPNSSFVEIMPCNFGGQWPRHYFKTPSETQHITFYWRLQAHMRKQCRPSPLEATPIS